MAAGLLALSSRQFATTIDHEKRIVNHGTLSAWHSNLMYFSFLTLTPPAELSALYLLIVLLRSSISYHTSPGTNVEEISWLGSASTNEYEEKHEFQSSSSIWNYPLNTRHKEVEICRSGTILLVFAVGETLLCFCSSVEHVMRDFVQDGWSSEFSIWPSLDRMGMFVHVNSSLQATLIPRTFPAGGRGRGWG